jgi:UPF0755 protein
MKMQSVRISEILSTEDWLIVLATFIFILMFGLNWFFDNNDLVSNEPVRVHIKKGMSFSQIADTLKKYKIINSKTAFIVTGKLLGAERKIKSGYHLLKYGLSNYDYLNALVLGKYLVNVRVTIPEGLSLREIASLLQQTLDFSAEDFLQLSENQELLNEFEIDHNSFEGYLMPDTYEFSELDNPKLVLTTLASEFKKFYDENIKLYEEKVGLNKNQIITLASIIEGETNFVDEMPRIAGVYLNRLKKGMKLQADPTVVYARGDRPNRILYQDLKINSPYNTYRFYGLPPGPINCPGRNALLAAVNPENHNFLYFVASGDGKSHVFAKTYTEHQINVSRYRKLTR